MLFPVVAAALPKSFPLNFDALDTSSVAFLPKTVPTAFGSYLQQTLDFTLIAPVFQKLNASVGTLQSRGEAHITVISPPEFNATLSQFLTIDEVNQIAQKLNIQSTPFWPICIGQQSQVETATSAGKRTDLIGKRTSVFNILIDAPGLVSIRDAIYRAYLKKGGNPSNFNPRDFYPHITLGFENHDWFVQDSVYKTTSTCVANVQLF
ncbi:hypothetical protein EDD86DRAFT_208704 [Gorgonomyces haynaldii]|nr:hypothetical protein EDD86DRAFT_208704 [Gorgonomyces haynaldii]